MSLQRAQLFFDGVQFCGVLLGGTLNLGVRVCFDCLFNTELGIVGSISDDGIVYGDTAPDGSEKAVVSIPLPCVPGKTAKEAVALTYGPAIANANKVEAQIDAALAEVNAMLEAVESGIVIAAPTEVEDAADIDVSVEVEVG